MSIYDQDEIFTIVYAIFMGIESGNEYSIAGGEFESEELPQYHSEALSTSRERT